MDEAQVIALVRNGKTDAFAEIVEHYQMPIGRYLYRITGDYEVAKDLVQDTFLKAYKSVLKTDSDLSFKAWLYRIATNNARQYHRRRRLISFIPFVDSVKHDSILKTTPNYIEEKLSIEETLLKVPADQKECLVLHFVDGFRYGEIADILNISEEAVRKRVARGSKEFKKQYSKVGGKQ